MHASKVQCNGVVHRQQLLLPLQHRIVACCSHGSAPAHCSVMPLSLQSTQHGVAAHHELEEVVLAELDLHSAFSF